MRAPLCGDNLVRIAFLDESGRERRQPIIVVAGVIIHGDHSYRQIEEALRRLVRESVPAADQEGFVFHATDLFHGSGYFKREVWAKEDRHAILRNLAAFPVKFCLPIVFGHVAKEEYGQKPAIVDHIEKQPERDRPNDLMVIEHMAAFARAVVAIERQMWRFPRDKICMLVAEDTDLVKPHIKAAHAFLRDPNQLGGAGYTEVEGLPLRKVVDTPHFAAKRDSSLLQLADLCAFLIMRRLNRKEDSQPFFEAIAPQLSWGCAGFGESLGSEQIGGGQLY